MRRLFATWLAVAALAACASALAAKFPPYATLPALPIANNGVEYEGHGQAEFILKEKTEVYRGKYWSGHLDYAARWGEDARKALAGIIGELQKGGWEVVMRDEPRNPPYATLRYTKDAKDAWAKVEVFAQAHVVVVERGLPSVKLALEPPRAGATRAGENADFPFLKRFPGSKLASTQAIDEPLLVQLGDKEPVMVAKGQQVKSYEFPPGAGRLEAVVVYREALKAAGWQVVEELSGPQQSDPTLTARYAKDDLELWVRVRAAGDLSLAVADAGGERSPARLKAELDKACKVAIYGLHFDFDKATLRPDTETALNAILKLLRDHPDLAIELSGHTDNVGKRDHNLKLSEARVNAARGWLVGKGINAERVTAKGYADTQPVESNESPEGRARNRRVELKKARCP